MEDIFRVNYYCYSVKIVTIKGDECLVLFQTEICYCIGVMVQPIRALLSSSRPSNRGQNIYDIKQNKIFPRRGERNIIELECNKFSASFLRFVGSAPFCTLLMKPKWLLMFPLKNFHRGPRRYWNSSNKNIFTSVLK